LHGLNINFEKNFRDLGLNFGPITDRAI